jgi:hypothetical protein
LCTRTQRIRPASQGNTARIDHEARAFRTLTLLLAVAEQALLELAEIAKPDEETRAAILELCERLYQTLQPGGYVANQISLGAGKGE